MASPIKKKHFLAMTEGRQLKDYQCMCVCSVSQMKKCLCLPISLPIQKKPMPYAILPLVQCPQPLLQWSEVAPVALVGQDRCTDRDFLPYAIRTPVQCPVPLLQWSEVNQLDYWVGIGVHTGIYVSVPCLQTFPSQWSPLLPVVDKSAETANTFHFL